MHAAHDVLLARAIRVDHPIANLCGDALRVVIHPKRSKMLHEVPRVPETRVQKLQSLRRDDYQVVLTLVANAVRG